MALNSSLPANASVAKSSHVSALASNFTYVSKDDVVCYMPDMITTNGFWRGVNVLDYALPVFILQLCLIVLTTRSLVFLLRPLHQPRVIAEIIGGIVLGPSVMGQVKGYAETLFPARSILAMETTAHLGLILFVFLIGVEMDAGIIRRMGRRSIIIAVSGMILPFCIGTATSFLFHREISHNVHQVPFLLFLGVALSVTAFPVLARILAETKLLNTDLGRTAMSAAVVNDICSWILLALTVSISDSRATALSSLWVVLGGASFVLIWFFAVRPCIRFAWGRGADAGQGVTDFQLCGVLVGLMLSALVADAIGVHSEFGAFVYGLVVPGGAMGAAIVEKLEDFVTGVMLPLFFASSGLRTDVTSIKEPLTAALLLLIFVLASVVKIIVTSVVAVFYAMPFTDGLSLGFLMNTRGMVEMIILNIGKDKSVLDDESFAVLVLASLAMTALVTPVVTTIHRPTRRLIGYKRRNLQRTKPDAEVRMLACFHASRHIPPIISLLAISNPTKRAPIFLYALHLIELTSRASALLTAASTCSTPTSSCPSSSLPATPLPFPTDTPSGISIQPLAAASPFPTMHDDVCRLAEEKHASLILLPFHKHLTIDGDLEPDANPGLRALNLNVLSAAPCSVAVLVDRSLTIAASRPFRRIALLFFGGPDDREALAFAWRMAENPHTCLSLLRFLRVRDPRLVTVITDTNASSAASGGEDEEERLADEEYLTAFLRKHVGNDRMVYAESEVASGDEVVTAVRGIERAFDLYVVGRGQGGAAAALTSGMTAWTECPELGPIGDLLASSDFAAKASVLVVQQYVGGTAAVPESPSTARHHAVGSSSTWGRISSFGINWGGRGN